MSSTQTQQQKKNRKAFSKTLKAQIKRKPHTEPINGQEYTYGILEKKSESSLFNNERFLIIRGHETFGYASKLPQETLLPFLEAANIPKCKVQIPLDKLQISNEKEVLIVDFQEDGKKEKTRWEFTCGSKVKAIEWRQKLEGAKNDKLLSIKNNAVKVILQDPNQSVEESDYEPENKKKKIIIERPDVGTNQKLKESERFNVYKETNNKKKDGEEGNIQRGNSKILVKDEESTEEKKTDHLQQEQQKINEERHQRTQSKQNKESASKQERFSEVNIFQSLLYSSPTRQQQPLQNIDSEIEKFPAIENYSPNNNTSNYPLVSKSQTFSPEKQSSSYGDVSPNRSKEEFLKRKKEESEMKEELREENGITPSFFSSVIKTLADNKYQLQKLKKDWGYEFAKAQNEFEIIQRFKTYVEIIVVKIVDQLALQFRKRYYKPIVQTAESLKYQIDGIVLQFFLHELKQVANFQKKGSIISQHRSKQAFQELKNYDYILQLTNNKGRIRVPLAMTVEYKGFVCLAKAIIPEAQSYSNLESLQKELDLLQAESRISNSIFENGDNGRIVPLMNKVYEKFARTQNNFTNNNPKKFDICYIQALKHYLPQDFYMYNTQSAKNAQQINSSHVLRRELIQHQDYDEAVFYGENMNNVIHRLKLPQHLKEAIDTLSEVSKSISERVDALVTSLENLDEFITNSKDLSKLMHGYGLNMRYLGLLLEKTHESWLKSIIVSQISARCAKSFFRFDLQDCIINLNETKMQNVRRFQIKQVITFMNKVFGNSEESDLFWTQLSRQSQENFQCYVDKKELNLGYFVQALQSQCRVQLINIFERKEDFFRVPELLSADNFSGFGLNSKTYDLGFTQLYTRVREHLKELTQESFQQLLILLNLQRKGSLPSHFQLNRFDEKVILYMINWLSPQEGRKIYYPEQIKLGEVMPTKTLYQIKLTEIKWLLKDKKEAEAEKVRDWMIEHVNRWLGQYHPVLSQLYDLFSRYFSSSKTQEKKATTYCKSSIKNIQKLLGQTNIKLADNYYMLAEIYVNYQKKTEALSSLKRAREILQQREGQATQAYGIIQLRIGQLLLASNMFQEALTQGIRAYTTLQDADDLDKTVEAIELIGRCYQLTGLWGDYNKFVDQLINVNSQLSHFLQDPSLLERTLKVLILPYFNDIMKNSQTSKQFLQVLAMFSSLNNITPSASTSSYHHIKSLIQQQNAVFPQEFTSTLQNDLQELLEEVESSGIMTRWKGFQNLIRNKSLVQKLNSISALNAKAYEFLLVLEALAVFLGEGWIEGVLRNQ